MNALLLEVNGLHAGYGASPVLFGAGLTVGAGEIVGLLGRNGMGKTTLVRCIVGLLKPGAGSVRFNGAAIEGEPAHRIARRGIALVPEGRQLFANLTVHEHLAAFQRAGTRWSPDRVYELFPRLAERRHHLGQQLSGGEQQMLAIGRALVTHPRLVILDEATEGLAPLVREEIWRALKALREAGHAMLVIDKYVSRLVAIADRHVILEKGHVVWQGTSEALDADRSLWKRYLGDLMAERSFVEEVKKLRLKQGEVFRGEGILAVTKALLESGVAYVAGYQGAPISHLMDVLADAQDILAEHGIHFENSANEATAAATLAASVNYPLRGAVTFKSTVGTNVACDALANLASGGVTGGALIIVGEDYGEGSSIMQERSHAFAMKSQIWLLDPRPNLPSIVNAVKQGFELSEATRTPVMLELRIRACHVHGSFVAADNRSTPFTLREAMEQPRRDTSRIVLPPASYLHEQEKVRDRWPAARRFIQERGLNEFFAPDADDIGIIVQGGHYNTLARVLETLGLADVYGRTQMPLYVLNVTYPLVDAEVLRFCEDKRAVLLVEEGQPDYIEQNVATILRRAGCDTVLHGKDLLPMAGEYTAAVVRDAVRAFVERTGRSVAAAPPPVARPPKVVPIQPLGDLVHGRPPGFCTGCPERPLFTAMKLVERELGPHHVSADIGCHLFSILPPFNIGNTTMGYGLGTAGASALNVAAGKRVIGMMGDGGFWHNGLTSGIANAVFNRSDNLTIVVDNSYSAATGGQDVLSSKAANPTRSTGHAIETAVRGVGVRWVRTLTNTYDLAAMKRTLTEALTSKEPGPKVLVAQSECMLNRQRREKPLQRAAVAAGQRVVRERFGVDPDTCTGDHSCIRLSGCPSLTIKPNPDPLRRSPVAAVLDTCVGCGLCGNVAHAAVLCPSFYRAQIVNHPSRWERWRDGLRRRVIGALQRRSAARRLAW